MSGLCQPWRPPVPHPLALWFISSTLAGLPVETGAGVVFMQPYPQGGGERI